MRFLQRVPNPHRLFVLEAVARTGSFTNAASELGMTQPSISRHMAKLESELATRLFDRQANRLTLTNEGALLVDAVAEAADRIEAALDASQPPRQSFMIAAQPSITQTWLAPGLSKLREKLEPIEASIVVFDRDDELEESGADMMIRSGPAAPSGFKAKRLLPEIVTPVASPEFAIRHGLDSESSPRQLIEAPLLEVDHRGRQWMSWNQWFAAHGLEVGSSGDEVRYDSYPTLVQQALSGHGVLLSWRHESGVLVDRGYLVEVGPTVAGSSGGQYALWHRSLERDPALRAALRWLHDILPSAEASRSIDR